MKLVTSVVFFILLPPERTLFSNQLRPHLVSFLDVLIDVAYVIETEFELVFHSEIHALRLVISVGHLIDSDFFHLILHVVLDFLIADRFVAVGLVFLLALNLICVLYPLKSDYLLLIALNGYLLARLLDQMGISIIDLILVCNAVLATLDFSLTVLFFFDDLKAWNVRLSLSVDDLAL